MILLKIGGGGSINLSGIIADLTNLEDQVIIIHGANALRDDLLIKLGIEKKVLVSESGYSSVFTDQSALDVLIMAYAGLRNKRIVELCQQHGINAVGLSGIDGKLVQGIRNRGIKIIEDGKRKLIRDYSGKPSSVNTELISILLKNGYVPVLTVPIMDENNYAINSENDDILNVLQKSVHADIIIQLIEAPGLLEDAENQNTLLKQLTYNELEKWELLVEGRMKRKLLALRKLFESGAHKVIIGDGRIENPISKALQGEGTIIQ